MPLFNALLQILSKKKSPKSRITLRQVMLQKLTKILNNHTLLFSLVFAGGLVLRLALLPVRWINPDEGAHLMDAKLYLDGLMPIVDFGARQPLYVFIYAVAFKLFGVSLWVGRIVPLVASMVVAFLLYLTGKQIFDKNVGLLSSAIYLFLPLVLFWSVIVKTEQVALVFVTSSIYLVIVYINAKWKNKTWLILAGICAAAAFYVRQPTVYLPMATLLFLLVFTKEKMGERLVLVFHYLLGYLAVVAGFFALYLKWLSIIDILYSQLNPLNLIWNRALHTLGLLPEKYRLVDGESFRILGQDVQYTITAWEHAIFMSLLIIAAVVLFALIQKNKKKQQAVILLVIWVGFVLLLYLFQSLNKGFYSQYFTEALPPLVMLASSLMISLARQNKINILGGVAFSALFYIVFVAQKVFWGLYFGVSPLFVLFTLSVAVGWVFLVLRNESIKFKIFFIFSTTLAPAIILAVFKILRVNEIFVLSAGLVALYFVLENFHRKRETYFVHAFVLLIAFCITAAVSGRFLGSAYEAVWDQQTLGKVRTILVENSDGSDTVLCGGMIWTLEAELQPFLNIAHPTEFLKKRRADFEEQFKQHRPSFIILDRYTKKKFQKYWPFLHQEIEQNYQLLDKVPNSSFEIKIFENMKHRLDLTPAFAKTTRPVAR